MRLACIDCGSNSTLLLVADLSEQKLTPVQEHLVYTRLADGLSEQGVLSQEAMTRTATVIETFVSRASELGAEKIVVVMTEAVRAARNQNEFISRISRLGADFEVLTGQREAELTFLAARTSFFGADALTVIDIGGGSIEIAMGRTHAEFLQSYPLGVVGMTRKFLHHDPPALDEKREFVHHVNTALAHVPDFKGTLVGLSGTLTTLAAMDLKLATYDAKKIEGHILSMTQLQTIADRLERLTIEARAHLVGLDRERADVIYAGAVLALTLCARAPNQQIVVSTRGLRYGALYEWGSRYEA